MEYTDRNVYFPFADDQQEPTICATPELLLDEMKNANIQKAIIVQPINYKFDHSFVQAVIESNRDKFIGCLLANPTLSRPSDAVTALEELARTDLFKMVRFNPYIWPKGEEMSNECGLKLYEAAGELSLPVGVMAFNGILPLRDAIVKLLNFSPKTVMILDHFGFAGSGIGTINVIGSDEWKFIIGLAKEYENVYIKISAFDRQSRCFVKDGRGPVDRYSGVKALIKDAVAQIGASRCIFGTDFPFVNDAGNIGYLRARSIVEDSGISTEESEMIMGGTIMKLLPLASKA